MANKYAGTQTEKNLETAFAGESQARNKYTYFASKAKKEGYEQIAALFLETADNEKEARKAYKENISYYEEIHQIHLCRNCGTDFHRDVHFPLDTVAAKGDGLQRVYAQVHGPSQDDHRHGKD